VTLRLWLGESLRWYLIRAKHPLKGYLVGHFWSWFCKPRLWIRYDTDAAITVCLRDYLQQRIFFDRAYERPLLDWLARELRPDDVFWDVGANIGAVTLFASGRCRRVVAFEPDPRSLSLLRQHVDVNRRTNVEIVPAALGEEPGRATLHQAPAANTGMTTLMTGRVRADVPQVDVRVERADDLLAASRYERPNIIKMDVEGAEHLVLRGATKLLASGSVRAIAFEDRRSSDGTPANAALAACLSDAGYVVDFVVPSDEKLDDGMANFVAVPKGARRASP